MWTLISLHRCTVKTWIIGRCAMSLDFLLLVRSRKKFSHHGGGKGPCFCCVFCPLSRQGNSGLHSTPSNYSSFTVSISPKALIPTTFRYRTLWLHCMVRYKLTQYRNLSYYWSTSIPRHVRMFLPSSGDQMGSWSPRWEWTQCSGRKKQFLQAKEDSGRIPYPNSLINGYWPALPPSI